MEKLKEIVSFFASYLRMTGTENNAWCLHTKENKEAERLRIMEVFYMTGQDFWKNDVEEINVQNLDLFHSMVVLFQEYFQINYRIFPYHGLWN